MWKEGLHFKSLLGQLLHSEKGETMTVSLLLLRGGEIGRKGVILEVRPLCTPQKFNLKKGTPPSKVTGCLEERESPGLVGPSGSLPGNNISLGRQLCRYFMRSRGGGWLVQILTTKVGLCGSQWETSYPG